MRKGVGCSRTVQPPVHMHSTVKEVLPGIQEDNGDDELYGGDDNMIDGLGNEEFPRGKGRDNTPVGSGESGGEEWVVATGQGTGKQRVGHGHVLGNGGGIETKKAKNGGQCPLRQSNSGGPDGDIIVLPTNHLGRVEEVQDIRHASLDNLLQDDIAEDFVAGCTVARGDLGWGVESVLRPEIVDVDDVEEGRHEPVCGYGANDGQVSIREPGDQVWPLDDGIRW